MIDTDKKNSKQANARRKYVANRRTFRRPERRIEGRIRGRYNTRQLPKGKKPLTQEEKEALIKQLSSEKDLDKSKELIQKAQENGIKVSEKILLKVKKKEKAREDMKYRIEEMKKRALSATEKDAVRQIQRGHADRAMEDLKASGRDGALGNEVAANSLYMAKDAKILAEDTPIKDSNSVMRKMLAENSVPADTLYERKRDDKSDQNREGIKHKDSTEKQMSVEYMKKIRGAAYYGG